MAARDPLWSLAEILRGNPIRATVTEQTGSKSAQSAQECVSPAAVSAPPSTVGTSVLTVVQSNLMRATIHEDQTDS